MVAHVFLFLVCPKSFSCLFANRGRFFCASSLPIWLVLFCFLFLFLHLNYVLCLCELYLCERCLCEVFREVQKCILEKEPCIFVSFLFFLFSILCTKTISKRSTSSSTAFSALMLARKALTKQY